MRKFLTLSALLFSLSSMASMTLRFTHNDGQTSYQVEATFTGSETSKSEGLVAADVVNGELAQACDGSFALNLSESKLSINFNPPAGLAEGGCSNDNLEVDITAAQYRQVMSGEPVEVTFRSVRFDKAPKTATVVMINH